MNEKKNKKEDSDKFSQPEEEIDEEARKQFVDTISKDNRQPQSVKPNEQPNSIMLNDRAPLKNATQKKQKD